MLGRMTDEELEKRIAIWSQHWDAGSFLRQALLRAYEEGIRDAWTEIRALGRAIEKEEAKKDS